MLSHPHAKHFASELCTGRHFIRVRVAYVINALNPFWIRHICARLWLAETGTPFILYSTNLTPFFIVAQATTSTTKYKGLIDPAYVSKYIAILCRCLRYACTLYSGPCTIFLTLYVPIVDGREFHFIFRLLVVMDRAQIYSTWNKTKKKNACGKGVYQLTITTL